MLRQEKEFIINIEILCVLYKCQQDYQRNRISITIEIRKIIMNARDQNSDGKRKFEYKIDRVEKIGKEIFSR